MYQFLYKAITSFITTVADPVIKEKLCLEFDKSYNSQSTKINNTIESIFKDEVNPFTMNKYYDTILKSGKAKMEQHIQQLESCSTSDVDYNERIVAEDLQEQLQSYCKVARKRIVDVVYMQTIERYMIIQINLYFSMLITLDDNTISTHLSEPSTKQARCQELQNKVWSYCGKVFEL
ncbi:hypothetical protein BGX27_002148 [Mortierella sp. AM989]|nr:hypothetical protein BGX27_002148 [Mortierella sp. AM989]